VEVFTADGPVDFELDYPTNVARTFSSANKRFDEQFAAALQLLRHRIKRRAVENCLSMANKPREPSQVVEIMKTAIFNYLQSVDIKTYRVGDELLEYFDKVQPEDPVGSDFGSFVFRRDDDVVDAPEIWDSNSKFYFRRHKAGVENLALSFFEEEATCFWLQFCETIVLRMCVRLRELYRTKNKEWRYPYVPMIGIQLTEYNLVLNERQKYRYWCADPSTITLKTCCHEQTEEEEEGEEDEGDSQEGDEGDDDEEEPKESVVPSVVSDVPSVVLPRLPPPTVYVNYQSLLDRVSALEQEMKENVCKKCKCKCGDIKTQ
jgi:hypothetical protein